MCKQAMAINSKRLRSSPTRQATDTPKRVRVSLQLTDRTMCPEAEELQHRGEVSPDIVTEQRSRIPRLNNPRVLHPRYPHLKDHLYSRVANTNMVSQSKQSNKQCAGFATIPDHDYVHSVSKSEVEAAAYLSNTALKQCFLDYQEYLQSSHSSLTLSSSQWEQLTRCIARQNLQDLTCVFLHNHDLRKHFIHSLMKSEQVQMQQMGNRKHGNVSVLMKKSYDDLVQFDWMELLEEAFSNFPDMMQLLVAICTKSQNVNRLDIIRRLVPKLGLIYAVAAQSGNPELSRLQRVVSVLLYDNICDQKVSDTSATQF